MTGETSSSPRAHGQRSGAAGTILWWGRSDPEYARNRILRQCLGEAGLTIRDFRPRVSATGDLEAALRVRSPVDLVWVPCFRQRDLAAARRWSARRGVPLIFDPLISAYDKYAFERAKFPEGGIRARRLLEWEQRLFNGADMLLADTDAHAEFFHHTHGVPQERIRVVPLCADERLFRPAGRQAGADAPLEVLFFGSFIPLQGPQVIVEAANLYQGPPVRWCLVGDGPLRAACRSAVRRGAPIEFEDWLPYQELPSRIARADIVLGIFGDTPKAARVVPNKFCQAIACARPMVTRSSPAYPAELTDANGTGIIWVPPADPSSLIEAVAGLAASPQSPEVHGQYALQTYKRYFSAKRVSSALAKALGSLLPSAAAQ